MMRAESEPGIYNVEANWSRCKERLLRDTEIPDRVKEEILEFVDVIDVSRHRQYFYVERLKLVARILKERFLHPTEKELRNALRRLSDSTGRRGMRYSDRTVEDVWRSLQRFYGVYKDGKYREITKKLRGRRTKSHETKPEDLVSRDVYEKLVSAALNLRDKTLISLLYDSGVRIGEALTLRIKDVEFDLDAMRILVKGKTGVRRIPVFGDSVILMHQYLDSFKTRAGEKGPDDYLFLDKHGRQMKYDAVSRMLKKVSKRAGIRKAPHPHQFRHTRASLLATQLPEAPLESYMGWVHGSKMSQTYVHLNDSQLENVIRRVYGKERKEEEKGLEYVPKVCMRCGTENPTTNKYCFRCGLPLDPNLLASLQDTQRVIESSLLNSSVIDPDVKELIKEFDPTYKDKILEAVLSQIISNPQLKEGFVRELLPLARKELEKEDRHPV